ncbi:MULTISPECIES: hypothetical protein [unclassified Ectothiorhodospira]|jgi:hypothetical protein|nr:MULTISPECIES: hypothetical protein [unclassified Ectothiorhodospira]
MSSSIAAAVGHGAVRGRFSLVLASTGAAAGTNVIFGGKKSGRR